MTKEVVQEASKWAANTTVTISIKTKILKLSVAFTVIISFNSSSNNTTFGIKMREGHEEELTGTIPSYLAITEDKTKTFTELQKGKFNYSLI